MEIKESRESNREMIKGSAGESKLDLTEVVKRSMEFVKDNFRGTGWACRYTH
jgi:hypothetical protein